MIVLVDARLLAVASAKPKVKYLLELLTEPVVAAHLYGDDGPLDGKRRAKEAEPETTIRPGWVELHPEGRDGRILVTFVREGMPIHRVVMADDSAYERIANAPLPPECGIGSDAEARQQADALFMLAAKAIHADLVVTERLLPLLLGHDPWSRVTVLRPEEALPVVGLYLRQQGHFVLGRSPALGNAGGRTGETRWLRSTYWWESTKRLLPEQHRWAIACRSYAQSTGDDAVGLLPAALNQRISQALQSRDRLIVATSVPQDFDTAEDVGNELDQILLWMMAAFDITAKVAHAALAVQAELRYAQWHGNGRWLDEVKKSNPGKALVALVTGNSDGQRLLKILAAFRNTIHGAALSAAGTVPVTGDYALETLVRLPKNERKKATTEMKALGGEAAWGVVAPFPDADLHLLPARFVEQLLPRALALLNALMAATPVEELDGVRATSGQLAHDRPLSLLEQRAIWQLGLS